MALNPLPIHRSESPMELFFNPHSMICLLISEREEAGKERERNTNVREKHPSVASPTHPHQRSNPQPRSYGTF